MWPRVTPTAEDEGSGEGEGCDAETGLVYGGDPDEETGPIDKDDAETGPTDEGER